NNPAESGGCNTPQLAAESWVRGSKSALICPVVHTRDSFNFFQMRLTAHLTAYIINIYERYIYTVVIRNYYFPKFFLCRSIPNASQ
ncbi:MAG: hypothetical protein KAJ60_04890, partial [Desulfobulbaceae bacterium]|nr:hypothetical protein [Desulfobulbaceae bacterium]